MKVETKILSSILSITLFVRHNDIHRTHSTKEPWEVVTTLTGKVTSFVR